MFSCARANTYISTSYRFLCAGNCSQLRGQKHGNERACTYHKTFRHTHYTSCLTFTICTKTLGQRHTCCSCTLYNTYFRWRFRRQLCGCQGPKQREGRWRDGKILPRLLFKFIKFPQFIRSVLHVYYEHYNVSYTSLWGRRCCSVSCFYRLYNKIFLTQLFRQWKGRGRRQTGRGVYSL